MQLKYGQNRLFYNSYVLSLEEWLNIFASWEFNKNIAYILF